MSSNQKEFKPIEGFEDKETYIVLVDGDIFYGRYKMETKEYVDYIDGVYGFVKDSGRSSRLERTLVFLDHEIVKLDKIYIHNLQELDDWVRDHPEYVI